MALPPKPAKKKKKKSKKPKTPIEIENGKVSSESDSDIEDEDEEDIDKTIIKKFPDFKLAQSILSDIKKTFPQTSLNGEKNIWIIKPA